MATLPYLKTLFLAGVLVCAGCAGMSSQDGGIAYKVDIDGAGWGMGKSIRESTATCRFVKRHPSTLGQLHYRMESDREIIDAILEANGYYDASVNLYLDETRDPVRVEIKVWRGEQYRFRDVDVRFSGVHDEALERIRPRIRRRQHAVASMVFDEEKRILGQLKHRGYPFPRLIRRTVDVDRNAKAVDLVMVFDPGSKAFFGPVRVEGLESLPDRFVRRQVPWGEGDRYDAKEIEDFEKKLLGSGLFSSVHVGMETSSIDSTTMPVSIRLSERSKRTVRLGVNYSDVGPGAKGYWENRSLFGGGKRLETELFWNPVEFTGNARFTRSGFLDAHQSLVLSVEGSREMPDAFDADKVTGTAMLLRDFSSTIQGGVGAGYKYSRVEQLDEDEHYAHVFFPMQAIFDNRNDRLNPVRGMQFFCRSSFFNDTLGSQSFFKSKVEQRYYAMLWERYRLLSALRLMLGSIDGAAIQAVPADERFYAGGGGSVRGYEYQRIGPQVDGVPTGGDKLVEFSLELRLQPGRRFGYAAFVDGGTVYNEQRDDFSRSLRYGAGVGLRWFTSIGPLRADVAYPLNPSTEQVERVQFYISLGQAF